MKIEREDVKNVKKEICINYCCLLDIMGKNDWLCDRSIYFMLNLRFYEKNIII